MIYITVPKLYCTVVFRILVSKRDIHELKDNLELGAYFFSRQNKAIFRLLGTVAKAAKSP